MEEELLKFKQDLERAKTELTVLYEVSNAMRTTLKLDEILYIILTGVTAHIGLGFNRAMLFLINEKERLIEGRMAIGPENGEQADKVWRNIEQEEMDLEDLISAYKFSAGVVETGFNQQVRQMRIPVDESRGGMLAFCALDGMPLLLTKEGMQRYSQDPVVHFLKSDELAVVPMKAKDKVNGIILADNFITHKPISKDDLRMLIMLANQAGLAIENSQLYEKTVIRSHSDYLTDLWNHGYFQYLLQAELEKSKAMDKPLSLLAIDIDFFKVYNDLLGHQEGDKILKELSLLMKKQSRKMDHVCRYGGEEFTIILPETEKQEALLISERLRRDIENHIFSHEDILPSKKLTVSIGVSSFPADGSNPSELIAYADKMLYQAKGKGRNLICG